MPSETAPRSSALVFWRWCSVREDQNKNPAFGLKVGFVVLKIEGYAAIRRD